MKKFLTVILIAIAGNVARGQSMQSFHPAGQISEPGIFQNISPEQDPRLVRLVGLHVLNNERTGKISGYRVEIFFSSALDARQRALQTKTAFLRDYPDTGVYVSYVSPDFKVRVGDFRTKNEALELMKKIQGKFPKAFIVPDRIEFPSLN